MEALKEVALKFTEEVNLGSDAVKKSVTEMMATAQASVSRVSERMLTELKVRRIVIRIRIGVGIRIRIGMRI